jgi:hypothetical protein
MTPPANTDPILSRFRAALGDMYGDRLERVMLFASPARGDGRPDSDYDLDAFLNQMPVRWTDGRSPLTQLSATGSSPRPKQ